MPRSPQRLEESLSPGAPEAEFDLDELGDVEAGLPAAPPAAESDVKEVDVVTECEYVETEE